LTSEIDVDCFTGKNGLPAVAHVYHDQSESQDVARIESLWTVVAAISVWRVPVEAGMQIRIGSLSPAIPLVILIPIFVPLIWLVSWGLESSVWCSSNVLVPRNKLPHLAALWIMRNVVLEFCAPMECGAAWSCSIHVILWCSFDSTALALLLQPEGISELGWPIADISVEVNSTVQTVVDPRSKIDQCWNHSIWRGNKIGLSPCRILARYIERVD
jgi:hypothetical protein